MNYPNYYAPAAPQVPMYNPAMYNPAFGAAQARLTQMEQQYPQFAQQQPAPPATQTQAPMPQGLNARAVTSKEEALGVPVDFSGALMVFTDVSHGKVYTKAFNMSTGSADFKEYALTEAPVATATSASPVAVENDYVTHKELNELIVKFLGGNGNAVQSDDAGGKRDAPEKSAGSASVSAGAANAKR